MLRIVCWKWRPINIDYRSSFHARNVNTLYRMVERNYKGPFELVCFTDDPEGIDPCIRTLPIWDTFGGIESPLGRDYPTCYRRLLAFSSAVGELIGGRFVSVDLDCVIVGDVTEIWSRKEDFVIWSAETRNTPYNGSMWMMNPGAREKVFTDFHPVRSPLLTKKLNLCGSDQAWMVYALGPKEATWTKEHGVYAWRTHIKNRNWRLPGNAKIVFFQGNEDPWDKSAQEKAGWIREHYR